MPPELEPELEPTPEPGSEPSAKAEFGTEAPGSAVAPAPASGSSVAPNNQPGAAGTKSTPPVQDAASHAEQDVFAPPSGEADVKRARHPVRLELAGLGERALGSGSEPRVTSLGGELRVVLGRGDLAPALAISYAPAARLETGRAVLEVRRLQASAGLRARTQLGVVELGGELALVAGFEAIRGLDFEHPAQGNGFELGLRAAALLATAARVGPLLALHASVFPAPNTFEALPQSEVGHMPHLWLGLAAGAFLGL
jgi:hypothetical protein